MADKKATLHIEGKAPIELPIMDGTVGPQVIDVRKLGANGYFTFDPGFLATASCESQITYIDGEKGVLLHRGFPIDQLANNALSQQRYTFSGAGIYHRSLFSQITPPSKAALAPILRKAMGSLLVEGEILRCAWHDVGTPDRLLALNQQR